MFIVLMISCLFLFYNESDANKYSLEILDNFQYVDSLKKSPPLCIIYAKELDEFCAKSKIGPIEVFQTGDTLYISSEGTLTNYLLGGDYSTNGLKQFLKLDFNIEKQTVNDGDQDRIARKFTYKRSFIKTVYNSHYEDYQIVSADIVDKDFILMDSIHIGMSKKDFFDKMFEKTIKYDFSKVKVLKNGDLNGDISQTYFFSNGLLRRIIIQSSYDWVPLDIVL